MLNNQLKQSDKIYLFLFKTFIVAYVFIDFIRRFVDDSKVLLMSLDVIIVITITYFIVNNNFKIKYIYNIPIYLRVILFLFFLIIIFQIFNPWYFDLVTYFVGFRSYLLAIPIILIGYHFAKNKLLISENMVNFILFFTIITLLYAIFQLMTDYTQLVGTTMNFIAPIEHGVHSYGDQEVQLTSSFFASSKRYGHFLIIMYLLYSGISLTIKGKIDFLIIGLFFIALIVSGARESFVLFLLINFIYMLKIFNIKKWLSIAFAVIILLTIFILYANEEFLFKLEFMLSSPDEYIRRIQQFFPFLFVDFSNPNMFFGLGVGKYGQESLLNPNILNLSHGIDKIFFHNLDFFNNSYGFADSGLAKVYIELGFLGLCIYLLFLTYIVYVALKNIFYLKGDKIKFSLSIYIILWVLYMMKGHPTISDIFMSYFLFFSIGYISCEKEKY